MSTVANLPIDTDSGGQVPLSSIAGITVRPDPIDIKHQALARYVDVVAQVRSGGVGAARSAAQASLAGVHFPLTYRAEVLGGTPDDPTSHWVFASYSGPDWNPAPAPGRLVELAACGRVPADAPDRVGRRVFVAVLSGDAQSLAADAGLLAVLLFAVRQGMLQIAAVRRHHRIDGGALRATVVRRAAAERSGASLAGVVVCTVPGSVRGAGGRAR